MAGLQIDPIVKNAAAADSRVFRAEDCGLHTVADCTQVGVGGTFVAGTLIETIDGPRPVDSLVAGDLVLTRDAGFQPLRWTRTSITAALAHHAPVVITRSALGNDRDLVVAPRHALLLDDWRAELLYGVPEVLVRAVDLLNHDRIYRRSGGRVSYCHVLFDEHHLVRAAGTWSESLHPGDVSNNTLHPIACAEVQFLFPDLNSFGPKIAPCLHQFEAACLTAQEHT